MIAVQHLEPGTKIKLRSGIIAEIEENPRDGTWLMVSYREAAADPASPLRQELAHADDVLEVVPG
jgi:hypothetical protein